MTAVVSLLAALAISLLITRVATMVLMLTGMSREAARFQARSALTGCGYTTSESESIVNHPVRRRVVMLLMLMGNVGIALGVAMITVLAALLSGSDSPASLRSAGALLLGVGVLWVIGRSRFFERRLNRVISYLLRTYTQLPVRDYVAVLHLQNEYAVSELMVEAHDWLAGKSLDELRLPREGVLVLGIQRTAGPYLGAPTADTVIRPGDNLILYGSIERIQELDTRRRGRSGDKAHAKAIAAHSERLEVQEEKDEAPLAAAADERR